MGKIEESIAVLNSGQDLSSSLMEAAMEEIMSGAVSTPVIVEFLRALNSQQITAEEVASAARVMRKHALKVRTKHSVVLDTCGTGGDGKNTFNISTAAAFVVAGAGIAVAKHGNRSASSRVGSADVLEALGVNINLSKDRVEASLDDIGIAFLFAQNFHPAMKYASFARKEIRERTIFNFLGPLTNPAGAAHQLAGVSQSSWARNLAYAFKELAAVHALVVCGRDNMDEITPYAKTLVYEVVQGRVVADCGQEIDFADCGFNKIDERDLAGGSKEENAGIILDILGKKRGPHRDVVLLNSGAAIYAASPFRKDLWEGIREGIGRARESIDSGAAMEKLELLKKYSHQ